MILLSDADSRSSAIRRTWLAARLALLSFASAPLFAQVEAWLSDESVGATETVTLVIETQGPKSASPDFSPLSDDFRILDRRSQRSVSIVNGQRTEQHQLRLDLAPRRIGLLEIPAIVIGDDTTRPLQLLVEQASNSATSPSSHSGSTVGQEPGTPRNADSAGADSDDGILLHAAIEPPRVHFRQQAVLTAKVYMAAPIIGARLHDPVIGGARLLPLGEDRYQQHRSGKEYNVYERRYAVFPLEDGRLDIPPLKFEGWARTSNGYAYPSPGEAVKAVSEALTLQVLPAPVGEGTDGWLPARDLTLSETGPATYRVRVGQSLERVISIRADGLMASDLPAVKDLFPHQIDVQRSRPRLWNERLPEGVIGTRRESIRLRSDEPGHFQLPAIPIQWWDTDTGRWSKAVLPARELIVSPVPFAGRAEPATEDESPPLMAARGAEHSSPSSAFPSRNTSSTASWWLWITAGLALAWIATTIAWWMSCRQVQTETPVPAPPGPESAPAARSEAPDEPEAGPGDPGDEAIAAVEKAYTAGDARAAQQALLTWARIALPGKPPSNLARLAQRCREPLRGEILTLEQAFFSPRPVHWELQPVARRLRTFEAAPEEQPASFRRPKPIRRRKTEPDSTT